MKRKLTNTFFDRSAPEVAHDLLGKYLVRKIHNEEIAYKITEVEAYEGLNDLASHASKGRTPRTEVMFGEPGLIYVYLIYGMYFLLNIVTGKVNHPAAVLIRSVEGITGPGRVGRKLLIDKKLNGLKQSVVTGLWFEDRGEKIDEKDIKKTGRIGVQYAGPIWAEKEYRFVLKI